VIHVAQKPLPLPKASSTLGWGTIIADPPWPSGKGGRSGGNKSAFNRMEAHRYSTMTEKQLMDLAKRMALNGTFARDAVMLLWATWMHLDMALNWMAMAGFNYASGFPWIKTVEHGKRSLLYSESFDPQVIVKDHLIFGPGVWAQQCSELVLIGRRGTPFGSRGVPRPARKGVIVSPRLDHSEKPSDLHEWVENKNFPAPRLEMFARRKRPGWVSWGDQL
jgi:N6-adenosine-specific RNA methylase IME4